MVKDLLCDYAALLEKCTCGDYYGTSPLRCLYGNCELLLCTVCGKKVNFVKREELCEPLSEKLVFEQDAKRKIVDVAVLDGGFFINSEYYYYFGEEGITKVCEGRIKMKVQSSRESDRVKKCVIFVPRDKVVAIVRVVDEKEFVVLKGEGRIETELEVQEHELPGGVRKERVKHVFFVPERPMRFLVRTVRA